MLSDEAWKALGIIIPSSTTILAGLFYRMWSRTEHKGNRASEQATSETVKKIYILMNGETEKKIKEAYEKGKKEAEEKQ